MGGVCGWVPENYFLSQLPYYVNFASACLSTIGSVIIIVSFLLQMKKQRKNLVTTLVFCLAIADLIASIGIFTSQSILLFANNLSTFYLCAFLRSLIQYGFLSSFLWTSCISFFLYSATRQSPERPSRIILMHVISWGVPAILVLSQVLAKGIAVSDHSLWCISTMAFEWGIWIAPLALCFCFNAVMYVLILRFTYRYSSSLHSSTPTEGQKKIFSLVQKRITVYILIFFLCWIWDIADHVALYIFNCKIYVLWLLQDLFVPLQGFFNFVVYGFSTDLLQWSKWRRMKYSKSSDFESRHLLEIN